MAIVVCGLSHKTVPLPVLEQVAFTPAELGKSLSRLLDHDPIHEGVILSTCNRTEVYATVHRFHPAIEAIRNFISDTSGVSQDAITSGLYTYWDEDAARHLFNVASGTDSMVVGEPQILGQVREAFRVAADEGTARRMLHQLFQRALSVGKRARTETAIARHVVSLPQAGARVASDLAGGLEGKRVVVVGAGRMSELAARAALDNGATDIVVANRSVDKAERLGTELGGSGVGLEELPSMLANADVLITATSSAGHVLERADLASALGGRPLVIVDLALPRDVDPDARDLEGVVLRDIEDLRSVVDEGAELRKAELPKVHAIVDDAVEDFSAWERSLALGPAIESLKTWAEEIRAAEVARLAQKSGGRGDTEALDRVTKQLVNKLLHRPMVQIRELVLGKDGQVYLEAFQEIFDLDTPDE
jgi:glutamyl-tRNA reductase